MPEATVQDLINSTTSNFIDASKRLLKGSLLVEPSSHQVSRLDDLNKFSKHLAEKPQTHGSFAWLHSSRKEMQLAYLDVSD